VGQAEMKRKLHRSRNDKWVAGVCGGVAKYLGVKSVLVRLAFVILAFVMYLGIVLYILLWISVGVEPEVKDQQDSANYSSWSEHAGGRNAGSISTEGQSEAQHERPHSQADPKEREEDSGNKD
jgi:phage shock protein C